MCIAPHCNTLHQPATQCNILSLIPFLPVICTATHYNTLQHVAAFSRVSLFPTSTNSPGRFFFSICWCCRLFALHLMSIHRSIPTPQSAGYASSRQHTPLQFGPPICLSQFISPCFANKRSQPPSNGCLQPISSRPQYTDVYIYIYTDIHVCIHTYHTYTPYVYVCTYIYICINIYMYVHICIHILKQRSYFAPDPNRFHGRVDQQRFHGRVDQQHFAGESQRAITWVSSPFSPPSLV